ncbi:hypothetical protein SGRIM128S_04819 [Streptomyces griseomycini]
MDAVLLSPDCADPLYRRSVKVSMGAVFSVPYARLDPWPQGPTRCMIPTTRHRRGIDRVKGDRVEIVVDAGDTTRTYEVVASRAGRRVETAVRRGVVEVSEVTRTGAVVRTARFMANRVLALVEQPVPREDTSEKAGQSGRPFRDVPET